jgi:hypothetical protein
MRLLGGSFLAVLYLGAAILASTTGAHAQQNLPRIALKSGESVDLRNFFVVINCRSILNGTPAIEVLEGPEEVTVSFRSEMVLPRSLNCPMPVAGGIIVATAIGVSEQKEGKLTFRMKYDTKQGPRQGSASYIVSLFPGPSQVGGSTPSTPSMNSTGPGGSTSSH